MMYQMKSAVYTSHEDPSRTNNFGKIRQISKICKFKEGRTIFLLLVDIATRITSEAA